MPQQQLMEEAERIAQGWVANEEQRKFLAGSQLEELKTTNARESEQLADAFLGAAFLKEQSRFLWSKKKYAPSALFFFVMDAKTTLVTLNVGAAATLSYLFYSFLYGLLGLHQVYSQHG